MTNAIFNNAYGVLGLLPNATQNEIKRRVKELERRLQIGEEIEPYEYDFGVFSTLINAKNMNKNIDENIKENIKTIKAANDELSSIQRQILHSFFRVYVNSENHAQTLKTLTKSGEGIREFYDSKDSWDFISKKNFAIALSLYMCEYTTEDFCLKLWDELLNSQNHLLTFKKIFLNDDELNVSETHFDGLRERLINELSRVFSEVADKTGEESVLAKFIKKFGTQNLDENIGKESFDELKKALGILEKLNISADGVYDDEEKATIKKCLKMFENGFEKLKNLGLYDSSKCLQIRDLIVEKIRKHTLDLYKELYECEEALKLTEFATKIAGTQGMLHKVNEEKLFLKEEAKKDEFVKTFMDIFKLGKEIKEPTQETLRDLTPRTKEITYQLKILKQDPNFRQKEQECQKMLNMDLNESIFNNIAVSIRNSAIDLVNNMQRYDEAKVLLSLALELTSNQTIYEKICQDLDELRKISTRSTGLAGAVEFAVSWVFWSAVKTAAVFVLGFFVLKMIRACS